MSTLKESVSVFDLPNLRQKPSYEDILQALQSLEIKPTSWAQSTARATDSHHEITTSRYLMSIISCSFDWFNSDDVSTERKEILWDLASKRVTERCGRSAMGEMTRTWIIPASSNVPELQFEVREPPLTGDNLGFKTWGTAFAIAKKLEVFGQECFSSILGNRNNDATESNADITAGSRVLELGAGTGLVGIAAAAIWSTDVVLTDLVEIQDNLDYNIAKNLGVVDERGGHTVGAILDWRNPNEGLVSQPKEFDIIIAADSLYDEEHPGLVANMAKRFIRPILDSRVLVAVPIRDTKTESMAAALRTHMKQNGLNILHEGWEVCRDDWESSVEEDGVKCWWGIFGLAGDVTDVQ